MFELWGGGAPFTQESTAPNNTLRDARNTKVRFLGDAHECWAHLHRRIQAGEDLLVGVASRCDEPAWARECLRKFIVAPGVSMMDIVTEERCEIYAGSKRQPLAELKRKTGVPYERMAFFDDQAGNVQDVAGLGVHCYLTPRGLRNEIVARGCAAAAAGGVDGWSAFGDPAEEACPG